MIQWPEQSYFYELRLTPLQYNKHYTGTHVVVLSPSIIMSEPDAAAAPAVSFAMCLLLRVGVVCRRRCVCRLCDAAEPFVPDHRCCYRSLILAIYSLLVAFIGNQRGFTEDSLHFICSTLTAAHNPNAKLRDVLENACHRKGKAASRRGAMSTARNDEQIASSSLE